MSATEQTREAGEAQQAAPPIVHRYPRDPMYRKSGCIGPQVGDVALCGWVKKVPNTGRQLVANCVVCCNLGGPTA